MPLRSASDVPPQLGKLSWGIFILLALHVAEELPTFPAWATRHFGTTTPAFYVLSHLPLMALAFHIAREAASPTARAADIALAIAAEVGLVTNGLFHVATTILFREYSPGLVTGAGLIVPFGIYFLMRVRRSGLVRGPRLWTAYAAGIIVSLLLTASLSLHMDLG